jgi:hypothetical protein
MWLTTFLRQLRVKPGYTPEASLWSGGQCSPFPTPLCCMQCKMNREVASRCAASHLVLGVIPTSVNHGGGSSLKP